MASRVLRIAAVVAIAIAISVPSAHADVGIIGDDNKDAFVGSGSLLLPPQVFHNGRVTASDCAGCSWRAVLQCEMTTAGFVAARHDCAVSMDRGCGCTSPDRVRRRSTLGRRATDLRDRCREALLRLSSDR